MLNKCIALCALIGFMSCFLPPAGAQQPDPLPAIIPIPQQIAMRQGSFLLSAETRIGLSGAESELSPAAAYLNAYLQTRMGKALTVQKGGKKAENTILLSLQPGLSNPEAYRLDITPNGVSIEGGSGAGVFYGVQTLIQLFPDAADNSLALPAASISDFPAFAYRGGHLDVGRHFFPVSFIKQYIDILARYKMNRFHWHLTEDQGWRIEIKKYPKLQQVAAYRWETLVGHYNDTPQQFDGTRYGGYYTQDEIREVVQYARERFVTVIPEIEMPGHAQAAIAAYPELGCTGKPIDVATKWGVFEDVFCPSETTFKFLEDVLTEVMALFPSEYIHIGGDECPKTQWKTSPTAREVIAREGLKDEHELQSYFIRRIEKFLNARGRQIIGWDEILEGGLAPNATVMSWRGVEGGIEAAKQKHKVIMTPTTHCYLDYYQALHPDEPLAIGGYLPLEQVYSYNPVPAALSAEEAKYILGVQGNLWTEYIKDGDKVEYMAYPRLQALAETGWSGEARKDFHDFCRRFLVHLPRLKAEGIQVANHFYDVKATVRSGDGKGVRLVLANASRQGDIRYNGDNMEPTYYDPVAGDEVPVLKDGSYYGKTFVGEKPVGRSARVIVRMHRAAGKTIALKNPSAAQYSGSGPGSLINGVQGSTERYGDSEWLGFEGTDCEAVIDMGQSVDMRKLSFRFFNGPGQWIYPPREIAISTAEAPGQFGPETTTRLSANAASGKIVSIAVLANAKGRYLRVRIPNYGVIPEGAQGAGHKAWLFVDEIVVE